ncbi:MAG: penicillin-binding protein 2 [Elusimicrobiota bacterium]
MWQNRNTHLNEALFKSSIKRLYIGILFLFVLIVCKLFYLQIIKGTHFSLLSDENRLHSYTYRAPRGKILARGGEIIVDNREVYTAILSKVNFDIQTLKDTVQKASEFMQINLSKINENINRLKSKSFENIYLARDIPRQMMFEFKERLPYMPGLLIVTEPVRRYRLSTLSAHILGYLSEIDSNELKLLRGEGYNLGDLIGKSGVENVYDIYLRGKDGCKQVEVDAKGRQIKIVSEQMPVYGNDVYLTISYNLQKKAEEVLAKKAGTIVAIDPRNGEVLAMVSSPGFDPTQFLYSLDEEKRQVLNDPRYPLMNRALQSQYAPGSVFKIITTIAALEERAVNKDTEYFCKGLLHIGKDNRVFKCWEERGHGRVDLKKAFINSCDVFYYHTGIATGVDKLSKYAKEFGFDMYTGIDLPSEKKGLVPTREWKRERMNRGWLPGDTANMSIGQGFLLVTPIQIANMLAAVVNGGNLYRPYIMKKIISPKGKILLENKPIALKKINISEDTINFLKETLELVVSEGTGRGAFIANYRVGGKTGTAENPHGDDHAWFVAAAPMPDPTIVICVFIENGGHGGATAAPLARELIQIYRKEADFKN